MELLERSESLEKLKSAFEQAILGRGQTIFISGEAGIGKTALVRTFLRQHKDRYILLEGFCDHLFAARPLGPLFDIAPRLGDHFAEILKSNAGRDQIFPAALDALESQTKPVILFFEDIQWADEATLDFIRFLARRISQLPCLFIMTLRDTEIQSNYAYRVILGELPPTDYVKLQLQPLSKTTVDAMSQHAGKNGEEIYRLTAGIPYYVSEVLASYHNKIPETVRDSILSLFHRQFDQTRELWEKISVIPGRIELEILKHMHTASSRVVEFCYRAGIILDDGISISFKHELFRKTIEESLSPHRQRELHQIAVEAMLNATGMEVPYARIVHHARFAGDIKRIQEFAPKAAQRASALGSHAEAAKFYQIALETPGELRSFRLIKLYEQYAYECYLTCKIGEAIKALEAALTLLTEEQHLQKGNTYRLLSRLYWYDNNIEKAEQFGMLAIQNCENYLSSHELAMAYSNLAELMLHRDQQPECLAWGKRALDIADQLDDHEVRSHALNTIGTMKMKDQSTVREGEKALLESLQIALERDLDEHAARAYTNLCFAYGELGRYAKVLQFVEPGIQYCHGRDLHSWTNYLQSSKASVLLHTGKWNEALVLSELVLESPYQQSVARISLESVRNTIRLRRGEPFSPGFVEIINEAKRIGELQRLVCVTLVLLEKDWLMGVNPGEEEIILLCAEKIRERNYWWFYADMKFWLELTNRQALMGDIQMTEKTPVLDEEWKTEHREVNPYLKAVSMTVGDVDQQKNALTLLMEMDADASVAKLEGRLREKGITQIPRGPRNSTRENVAGLTKRQMEVLSLLATGLQNKEIADQLFLSAKTIDHHISDILSKLDVNTRSKAVARAVELGLL
jgi:DNA-binding CsgD family transcriptional regulator